MLYLKQIVNINYISCLLSIYRIFAEGINWGRVAALLCFAYRIVIEVSKEKASQFGQFVKLIVHHVVRFIREKIVDWIVQRGGWVSCHSYLILCYNLLHLSMMEEDIYVNYHLIISNKSYLVGYLYLVINFVINRYTYIR